MQSEASNLRNLTRSQRPAALHRNITVLGEDAFHRVISLERKRAERSRKPFLLMLLQEAGTFPKEEKKAFLAEIVAVLGATVRETDIAGWYRSGSVAGLVFTEIECKDRNTIASKMQMAMTEKLSCRLSQQHFKQTSISFYLFPDDWQHQKPQTFTAPAAYPTPAMLDGESATAT